MIRAVVRGKWRCDVAGNKTTETTYTGPKPESPSGLGIESSTMPTAASELTDEERAVAEGDSGEVSERRKRDDEDDEKYEVVVDGHPLEVTLGEALNGYVRQETFHSG